MFFQPNPNIDLMGENVSMVFALLTIFFMVKTRPRRTEVFIYAFIGMIISAIEVALHVGLLLYPSDTGFTYGTYLAICILYHIFYMFILNFIYAYAWQLSYKQRLRKHILFTELTIFDVIYIISYYFIFRNELIFTYNNGQFLAGPFFNFFLFFGLADAIMTLFAGTHSRKDIPKTIYLYVMLFGVIDLAILTIQILNPTIVFASISYIAPFFIYYLLFHSNPMDEVSGCRNMFSFETTFLSNKRWKRNCTLIYGTISNLPSDFSASYSARVSYLIAEKCRKIEALSSKLKVYTPNPTTYMAFIYDKGKKRDEIIEKVGEVISAPVTVGKSTAIVNYKLYRIDDPFKFEDVNKLFSFIGFLRRTHETDVYTNEYITAGDDDYEKFKIRDIVADALLDIRKKRDLDDERVLCYTQPIYSVAEGKFKTAESLMRMKIDGKMYFPDSFIPVAEETNCIHVLTLIMINKVCKKIKELEKEKDFECITVNCSTLEFSDNKFANEVLDIIDSNKIERSKIRLELTESSVSISFNTLLRNMNTLTDEGIYFYLDDFGTGYSNWDRILSCPFRTVKFDKSLLYKALADETVYSVTKGMVKALNQKGILTLVEGVEDEEQRDKSMEIGFQYIQGYFYSKPVPADDLKKFFEPVNQLLR